MRAVIIGAGVIGLATAVALARRGASVMVLEKEARHGTGSSSRNSEVIHAGIYYEPGSLKARLCVRGKQLLYEYLAHNDLPHARCGKLIVATEAREVGVLEALATRAAANGVADLVLLTPREIAALEPNLSAEAALLSPSTGILSVHDLMHTLDAELQARGGEVVTHARVAGADLVGSTWQLDVATPEGLERIETEVVVNSAGLFADRVAGLVMEVPPDLRLNWTKGSYFALRRSAPRVSRLIYPCPEEKGLGIHLTLDLAGELRLGPDVQELSQRVESYNVDVQRAGDFLRRARRYLPELVADDLRPAYAGIRGQRSKAGFRDFYVAEESERGAPGWVNLIGMDSPGLTACLAIGEGIGPLLRFA